ncbi:TM0106 family RecB-like putative nuclease [Calothrix sp. 336/3]|uniref:TM0106 family RecB-like putative nuclease n=1 Tax=Calothrix sp. 336/3 TaxID=1337936 RepID=UPI0004E3EE35|nr:TM0106 family RecB-like putative nuclease [Calothrix sp. 336/3]AKG24315.1 recombinase B [Calothrix sp. 336/3]
MLINAELLLQYQRCKRRPYLDTHGDFRDKDAVNDLLVKLQQDRITYQANILANWRVVQPQYHRGNLPAAMGATLELMEQGVECIHQGVLIGKYADKYTLVSRPDLLVKQPGVSRFGDWVYEPIGVELGKRPKQEYQVVVAFHAQILAAVQQAAVDTGWLILRGKEGSYPVDLGKWVPQMGKIIQEYIQTLESEEAPEVFISRQKCTLCPWYSTCYAIAQSQKHLSLLPGVTPVRYAQLQGLDITTLESLAATHPTELENLPGFDSRVAPKLILQAKAVYENRPLILLGDDGEDNEDDMVDMSLNKRNGINHHDSPIELYFDIEAQPDLNLDYLLGVLVMDRQNHTEKFYSLLAETPADEKVIWQQFLDLVNQYPDAPIYHFCVYEVDTVKRLAKQYRTPYSDISPILNRFVDVYEKLTQTVALPVESYALKTIARWLGFEWRDKEASGAKCIYWYDQWLKTGDRTLLETIQRYNEDDCRATRSVKDWLVEFLQNMEKYPSPY